MGVAINILSVVLKLVVNNKIGNELANELIGISIDGISEKGVNGINDFINGEKAKIKYILSKENMESMNIPEENFDFVVAEIKDLLSKVKITDEVFRQCKYDNVKLSAYLWDEYRVYKNSYIEYESDIKKVLFDVADALIKLLRDSEEFEKNFLIQICNSVDNTNAEIQKVSEYMQENFSKLDDNSQLVLNILWMILEQIQKMNRQHNETRNTADEEKKFQNNKKQKYIENWNSRLFLHLDDDKNPITLASAFIIPRFDYYIKVGSIKFSDYDSLTEAIEKFIQYDKTSNLLITGSPGIGKTSIISWIANKYQDDEDIIILRFRDWSNKDLEKGLFNAICNSLGCESVNLENKILIIDGFDEIKSVNERKSLIQEFFNNTLDFDDLKVIITSRPDYLDTYDFQNVFKVLPFDISQIKEFYQIIKGEKLDQREIDIKNLDVLGIPVILYMAIMTNIDLTLKTTKPELYNKIFAEKGGIFDRFCFKGLGYDGGFQPLRDKNNVKIYLNFLQQIAFSMFEKNDLVLTEKEYDTPELIFQGETLSVIEFPIKPFFECDGYNIEFIHRSIYEYFFSEYVVGTIIGDVDISNDKLAGILGKIFKGNILSKEILEFLNYKVNNSKLSNMFKLVNDAFQLMLQDGMIYYIDERCKNANKCEINIFTNMLEFIHLWNPVSLKVDPKITDYLKYKNNNKLNLEGVDLRGMDLSFAYLHSANLRRANLSMVGFTSDGTEILDDTCYELDLTDADLRGADLRGRDIGQAYLSGAKLEKAICDERIAAQDKIDLSNIYVYVAETQEIISYEKYCARKK